MSLNILLYILMVSVITYMYHYYTFCFSSDYLCRPIRNVFYQVERKLFKKNSTFKERYF